MALDNDGLKRLYAQFPKLRNSTSFTTPEEFNAWRIKNAPEIPESVWYDLQPETPNQTVSQTDKYTSDKARNETHATHTDRSDSHNSHRPTHGIEEDKIYQNTINNHVEDWNNKNPNNKFTGKTFLKDPTGKVILNPELQKSIPKIHDLATQSIRTGFGDEAVDKYRDSEKYRVYKKYDQDPAYQALQKTKTEVAYDRFVLEHPEKAFFYARKDKELKKALKRREKNKEAEYKEKKKKYKSPNDDPTFQKLENEISSESEAEFNNQVEAQRIQRTSSAIQNVRDRRSLYTSSQRLAGTQPTTPSLTTPPTPILPPQQIDRETIRNEIKILKYEEFFKNYPEKAKDYARKNPEIKRFYEDFKARQKLEIKARKNELKTKSKNNKGSKRNILQEIEQSILLKSQTLPTSTTQIREEQVKKIRRSEFENFARSNPNAVKKLSQQSPELKHAIGRVESARKMTQSRGLIYKLRSTLFDSKNQQGQTQPDEEFSPLKQQASPSQNNRFQEGIVQRNQIGPINPQSSVIDSDDSDDGDESTTSQSFNRRDFDRFKSRFQTNTPSGDGSPPRANPELSQQSHRPRFKRPRMGQGAGSQAEKLAADGTKKLVMTGLRAAAPYIGIALLVIFVILILIIIIYLLISGNENNTDELKVTLSKSAPETIPDDSQTIEYILNASLTGTADDVKIIDPITENAIYVSSSPQGRLYDDAENELIEDSTLDKSKVKKVTWSLSEIQGRSSSSSSSTQVDQPPSTESTADTGTIHNLGLGGSDGKRVNDMIRSIRPNSPIIGYGDEIVQLAREFKLDPLIIIVWFLESQFCTDNGMNVPSTYGNYNCGNQDWDASLDGADVARWSATEAPPERWSLNHNWTFVPSMEDGLGLHFDYIDNPLYTGKTFVGFYEIYNPCSDSDQFGLGCGAQAARAMYTLLKDSLGPACDGPNCYVGSDGGGGGNSFNNQQIKLIVRPKSNNLFVTNIARAEVIGGRAGNGTIDVNSTSLNQIMSDSATNANIPIAFFKAILKVETGGAITDYTDEDVVKLSANDWWQGLIDDAPNVNNNDPLIIRGFAYNTCLYHPGCSPPTDVRGISQFLLETFNGIKSRIPTDGREPDRRYIRDALYASGLYHADNAAWYDSKYGASGATWSEDKIRKVATAYCTGDLEGNPDDLACAQAGVSYAELTWRYYQEYSSSSN